LATDAPLAPLPPPTSGADPDRPAVETGTQNESAEAGGDEDESGEDEDAATVSIAALRAARAAAAVPQGPTVQAVHCPDGHPNPPHLDQCRRCAAPITDRSVTIVARPILGTLRFDDGRVEALDAPLVIGRKPNADQTVGSEAARAIALDDPDKLLSRVHAEVRLAEWQVHILDRESMNHTYVQLPGQTMFQLRPGEPFPIPPGTRIVFADVTSCRYTPETE
jgi:hypothetical protein